MLDEMKTRWFCSQVGAMKNSMYALAIGILKNEADAEDAIQNALLSAYEHLDALRLFDKIKPWVLKILTRNLPIADAVQLHGACDLPDAAAPCEDLDTKHPSGLPSIRWKPDTGKSSSYSNYKPEYQRKSHKFWISLKKTSESPFPAPEAILRTLLTGGFLMTPKDSGFESRFAGASADAGGHGRTV